MSNLPLTVSQAKILVKEKMSPSLQQKFSTDLQLYYAIRIWYTFKYNSHPGNQATWREYDVECFISDFYKFVRPLPTRKPTLRQRVVRFLGR